MTAYGLIKATSRAMRSDTITDLRRINNWLRGKGLPLISPYGPSVRALENSVSLGIEKIDATELPKLERSESFYRSILPEIKDTEKIRFKLINKV